MKHGSEDQTSVSNLRASEVQEEANFDASCFQLIQKLSFVSSVIFRRNFNFYDDAVVHEQVRIVIADDGTFVRHMNALFDFGRTAASDQLDLESPLVNASTNP
jgi:hypothetical protein